MDIESLSKGEQTRLLIIEAAHDLFLSQGYHGTSMRQIATQAEIALSGIYNHFANKEEIFEAVFYQFHPYFRLIPLIEEARGDTAEEIIHNMANMMVQQLRERPQFLNIMFIEIVEFRSAHAAKLYRDIFPFGEKIAGRIKNKFGHAIRNIPDSMILQTFVGMFFSIVLAEKIFDSNLPNDSINGDERLKHFVDVYLHGILSGDSK